MPEGHTLHRLANTLAETFAGRVVQVCSPQGRFAESAALLDGTRLTGADAYGKHLVVEFEAERLVHIHLGLYGSLDIGRGTAGTPRGAVRLRIVADAAYADLRGPNACELWTPPQLEDLTERLGPDPLRTDADPNRAWRRIERSRAPIATLLMDQSVVAGVGNVYRAEVLFRHRIDPFMEGRLVRRREWSTIWDDLCALMAEGVRVGRIDTVRPQHEPDVMGREPRVDDHGGEVYVYRRMGDPCLVCGTRVRREVLAGRNLFWCPRCQRRTRRRSQSGR